MATSETSLPRPSLRVTKVAAIVACMFLLPAVGLSPGPYSSLGMPWLVFFCTWGVMLFAAFISFVGYFAGKRRGDRISAFYVIAPVLLFVTFLVFLNLRDIVRIVVP